MIKIFRKIDFEKEIKLIPSLGLCNELKRHYLTFLHPTDPLVFVKTVYNQEENKYEVRFFAKNGGKAFK